MAKGLQTVADELAGQAEPGGAIDPAFGGLLFDFLAELIKLLRERCGDGPGEALAQYQEACEGKGRRGRRRQRIVERRALRFCNWHREDADELSGAVLNHSVAESLTVDDAAEMFRDAERGE